MVAYRSSQCVAHFLKLTQRNNGEDEHTPKRMGDNNGCQVFESKVHESPIGPGHSRSTNQHEIKRPDMDSDIDGRGQDPALPGPISFHQIVLQESPPVYLFKGSRHKEKDQGNQP